MSEPAAAPSAEPAWPSEEAQAGGLVNQPWRAMIAVIELVLAAFAGWGATWCWSNSITRVTFATAGGTDLTSRIYSGPWVAAAIGAGLVGALLILDAFRELVLASRARRRFQPG